MNYEIAEAFKNGHAELQKRLGSPFVAYNATGQILPSGFYGISKEESFSNYKNRTITTDYDVSYLQNNFSVAYSGEIATRMRIWRVEPRIINGQRIGTRIYTTSLGPQTQLVMTSNGLFAI
jgi:hypothetical protein